MTGTGSQSANNSVTGEGTSILPRNLSVAQDANPSVGANDSLPAGPIGGRLQLFSRRWELSTTDAWVLRTMHHGLTIEFLGTLPRRFLRCPLPQSSDKIRLMEVEIHHLLDIRVIKPVPLDQQGTGFYSTLFLVPKNSGLEGHPESEGL